MNIFVVIFLSGEIKKKDFFGRRSNIVEVSNKNTERKKNNCFKLVK